MEEDEGKDQNDTYISTYWRRGDEPIRLRLVAVTVPVDTSGFCIAGLRVRYTQ